MDAPKKTLLLILDGWGMAPESAGNCVRNAATPHLDRLLAEYPSTRLTCSGRAVGLPDGFMGNSEVGHMNIGGGRGRLSGHDPASTCPLRTVRFLKIPALKTLMGQDQGRFRAAAPHGAAF